MRRAIYLTFFAKKSLGKCAKISRDGAKRDAAHVQGTKKLACHNEALVPFGRRQNWPGSFSGANSYDFAEGGPGVPASLCGNKECFLYRFFVPPILAAPIFPSPGQRGAPI
jgi:hypothetical protein